MEAKKTRGKPRAFKNKNELLELYEEYCLEVKNNGFLEAPTILNFQSWLERQHCGTCDRKTIYLTLNKYYPTTKKEFERIRADTLVDGAISGKYIPSITIFGLKNWCKWADNPADEEKQDNELTIRLVREEQ